MSDDAETIVAREGRIGRLTLNRPQAIGALTTGMCRTMTAALLEWLGDPAVEAVIIDHAGDRGFCAGGDVRTLADSAAGDGVAAREFFYVEYQLDHLISVYPKPIITVMDGLVMGGGVGISLPAAYRIATERTTFAMPETGIGLFPDVGAGWHLPRLHGRTGVWLALTGARIRAADCELLGIATDIVPAATLPTLKADIAADPAGVERWLTEVEADAGRAPISEHHDDIDRLFAGETVETIVAQLRADGSDWAREQLAIIAGKSPLSVKVALRLMQRGAKARSLAEDLAVEYRIASRVALSAEFREGVRAVIVDKDNAPRWRPGRLEEVTDAMVDDIFAPLSAHEEWKPLPEAAALGET
ncbi:MAG: enoyl-CoA hydratase/isomerase family protein [Caulobacterales bacterium]